LPGIGRLVAVTGLGFRQSRATGTPKGLVGSRRPTASGQRFLLLAE
jgi:hypothetical protein